MKDNDFRHVLVVIYSKQFCWLGEWFVLVEAFMIMKSEWNIPQDLFRSKIPSEMRHQLESHIQAA